MTPAELRPIQRRLFRHGGLVMSSVRPRCWQRGDGSNAHHLIDPRTGAPAATDVLAVAVAAFSAARAEALAKATIVAGSATGAELLEGFGVEGWILTDDEVIRVGCSA